MRICLVYDCLFPHTVGGAERWLRHLAERLVEQGHEVTYVTRLQWDPAEPPEIPGVSVVAVSRAEELYDAEGRRKVGQTLRFGWGALSHLIRHRRSYDVVHVLSFPYFSLLGARVALAGASPAVFVEWLEVWSTAYWREYLGGVQGAVGRLVQWLCARATRRAFVFSELNRRRLREAGTRGEIVKLPGLYTGPLEPYPHLAGEAPLVAFAGRHIPEKRVPALVEAIALARKELPDLRGAILGDGPERGMVEAAVDRLGLREVVDVPGFVSPDEVHRTLAAASCVAMPSRREGYGMVVIEAAAHGTPVVVCAGEDNAAVELVEEGVNGFVAPGGEPAQLAEAIVAAVRGGAALRESTAAWFAAEAARHSADASVAAVLAAYESARS